MQTEYDFLIGEGDTGPSLPAVLQDSRRPPQPVSLSGASDLHFVLALARGGDVVVDATFSVVDAAAGSVRYDWQAGDTDAPGEFLAEFRATLANGEIVTVPNDHDAKIRVRISPRVAR